MTMRQKTADDLRVYWEKVFEDDPPLISFKRVEIGSQGIINRSMLYRRKQPGRALDLEVVEGIGSPKITKSSLISLLANEK